MPRLTTRTAMVPEGTWLMYSARRSGERWLRLVDHRHRVQQELSVDKIFAAVGKSERIRMASNGQVVGLLAQIEDRPAMATVSADGRVVVSDLIDERYLYGGELTAAPDGRFIVYTGWGIGELEGARLVRRLELADDEISDVYDDVSDLVVVDGGYVTVHVSFDYDEPPRGVSVRWVDAEGRVTGTAVLLANEEAAYATAVADDTGVAIAYRGEGGLKLARVGGPGEVLMRPVVIRSRRRGWRSTVSWPEAILFDRGAYWIVGDGSFAYNGSTHYPRYRERAGVLRVDEDGRLLGMAVLPTVTGSTWDAQLTMTDDGPVGFLWRDSLGKRGSTERGGHARRLTVRCPS